MKKVSMIIAILFIACFVSLSADAQTGIKRSNDARVAKALNQTKTQYDITQDGDYKVAFRVSEERTQLAHVSSETVKINGLEMRMIFSYAMIADAAPSQEIANLLLLENSEYPQVAGLWAIAKMDDGKFATFNFIYIPAAADGKTLDALLQNLVVQADKIEERLTKKDAH